MENSKTHHQKILSHNWAGNARVFCHIIYHEHTQLNIVDVKASFDLSLTLTGLLPFTFFNRLRYYVYTCRVFV